MLTDSSEPKREAGAAPEGDAGARRTRARLGLPAGLVIDASHSLAGDCVPTAISKYCDDIGKPTPPAKIMLLTVQTMRKRTDNYLPEWDKQASVKGPTPFDGTFAQHIDTIARMGTHEKD